MPPGVSKRSNCRCPQHEIADRYEPEPAVGFVPGGEGVDAIHWSAVGRPQRTKKLSVIQVRAQDVLPAAVGDLVLRAIRTAGPHLEAGALVTVDSLRHRVRLLPI